MEAVDSPIAAAHLAVKENDSRRAEALCRSALRSCPIDPNALCLLASLQFDRGDDLEALRLLRTSLYVDPEYLAPYPALARFHYVRGEPQLASEVYREWERVDPDNPEVEHMIAATSGEHAPRRCSDAYVRTHFDDFSASFDEVLVNRLEYRGPEVVSVALGKALGTPSKEFDGLEIGCGTGLCGPVLRPYCRFLAAVDLSRNMIERASERACYDELTVEEICSYMRKRPSTFDLIVGSDVLIYFGDLAEVLACARTALRYGGKMVFTVEALSADSSHPYRLTQSGRYCHQQEYIREACRVASFDQLSIEDVSLRSELGKRIPFFLATATVGLQRSPLR